MSIHINFVIVCIILSFTVPLRIDLIHDVLKADMVQFEVNFSYERHGFLTVLT